MEHGCGLAERRWTMNGAMVLPAPAADRDDHRPCLFGVRLFPIGSPKAVAGGMPSRGPGNPVVMDVTMCPNFTVRMPHAIFHLKADFLRNARVCS